MRESPNIDALMRQGMIDALTAELPEGTSLEDIEHHADEMLKIAKEEGEKLRLKRLQRERVVYGIQDLEVLIDYGKVIPQPTEYQTPPEHDERLADYMDVWIDKRTSMLEIEGLVYHPSHHAR